MLIRLPVWLLAILDELLGLLSKTGPAFRKSLVWALLLMASSGFAADFSFVLVPDCHMGAGTGSEWRNQQQWIAANQAARKIQGVFYEGDLEGLANVWDRDGVGLTTVDAMGVPWGAAPGNHDYDTNNVPADRHTSTFDAQAGYSRISGKLWYGGYWTGDPGGYKANQYILFSVGSRQFLVLFLEFFPRPGVLAWAGGILAANPSREVLILTHGYVTQWGELGTRGGVGPDGYSLPSTDSAGTDIEAWAADFANVRAIFGGHYFDSVNFSRHRTDTGTHGNPIHGMFANYQDGGVVSKQYVVLAEFTGNNVTFSQMNTTTGFIDSTTYPPYTLAWAASSTGLWPFRTPCRPPDVGESRNCGNSPGWRRRLPLLEGWWVRVP